MSTPLLGLALPLDGTTNWGTLVNASVTALIDSAIAGTTTLSVDSDVTLSATAEAANQARQAVLLCTGARTALRTIIAPAQSKTYVVINSTTGGYGVKLCGVGPTTGITVPAGQAYLLAWSGSDFVITGKTQINLATDVTGTLPVANGGTGATGAAGARTNLGLVIGTDVPSPTGTGASGTWNINITGSAASATNATNASFSTTQSAKDATTAIATTEFADRFRSFFTGATSGTAAVSDRGCLLIATSGITVPSGVFSANDAFTIINNTASNITVGQGSGLTMYWAGVGSTGSRTLAGRGLATVIFVSSTVCYVLGGGLT